MNTEDTAVEKARTEARSELANLQASIGQARAELERIEAEIARSQVLVNAPGDATLVAVNQQLVIAALRAQMDAENAALSTEEASVLARARAQADQERRYAQLSEANEHLVLAAIGAQELQAAAEEAHRRQTHLMSVVAHELRHPLAPIRSAAAVLARIPEPPRVLARMQGIIEMQVRQMARLVDDLLDTTRAATGKLRIDIRRVDLVDVIEEAIVANQPSVEARAQHLTRPRLPASLPIHGDSGRLVQVFANLLDNASKYTPDGGEIELSVDLTSNEVVIDVSDTGIGITPEALSRVFDPFVQDLHATVFNGVGLGLGLTVVRELVEAHGGTVSAHSDGAGLGSRFVVTLPLATGKVG
ncbi:sensor histidine kinase [Ramlibacter sp.]|uniref:sensor histidine kinase n=1 Tax=Ramlibacter sp. TaxID=1917967 RepID=UPI002FCC38AA